MKLVNCTPNVIRIFDDELNVIKIIPESGLVSRLATVIKTVSEVDGIKITETVFGETTDLPDMKEGALLIVSRLVSAANPNRKDLLVPNQTVRKDENGRINLKRGDVVGCKSFTRN